MFHCMTGGRWDWLAGCWYPELGDGWTGPRLWWPGGSLYLTRHHQHRQRQHQQQLSSRARPGKARLGPSIIRQSSLLETRPSQGIKLTTSTPAQDSHLTPPSPHTLTSHPHLTDTTIIASFLLPRTPFESGSKSRLYLGWLRRRDSFSNDLSSSTQLLWLPRNVE